MKFCVKCGQQLSDDLQFCTNCGTQCPASDPPAQPSANTPPAQPYAPQFQQYYAPPVQQNATPYPVAPVLSAAERHLLDRKETPFTRFMSKLNHSIEKIVRFNVFPILNLIPLFLFFGCIVSMPGTLSLYIEGDEFTSLETFYADVALAEESPAILPFCLLSIFLVIAVFSCFLTKARRKGSSLVISALAVICHLALIISNFALKSRTLTQYYHGETVTANAQYTLGGVNWLLLLSMLVLAAATFFAHFTEKEKQYNELCYCVGKHHD